MKYHVLLATLVGRGFSTKAASGERKMCRSVSSSCASRRGAG